MPASQATLSAASDDRKSRLAKLKTLKRKQPTDETATPESTRSPSPPSASHPLEKDVTNLHLSGRNYDAETRGAKLGFENAPVKEGQVTLEQQALGIETDVRDAQRAEEEEKAAGGAAAGVDLFKLQPKKPNWDLKRDLAKKLTVLDVRTDNAIARLVRERIAQKEKDNHNNKAAAAASSSSATTIPKHDGGEEGGEEVGMDGVALVEGLRVREREDEDEIRREQEEEDDDDA